MLYLEEDVLFGSRKGDLLIGSTRNEVLFGGKGDDVIQGGLGHDVLIGGRGNDELTGGLGVDVLKGGGGEDTFYFYATTSSSGAYGVDRILDFNPIKDKIIIEGERPELIDLSYDKETGLISADVDGAGIFPAVGVVYIQPGLILDI